ncbi:MAG: AAA family ATPase [Nitrososphaeria archaeon]|nr:AAA family ATPase [Nitrososphaeria archaeon]
MQSGEKILDKSIRPLTYIREVILENFMSYEYARIPLSRGLNIVCGPNGSGKSSILLGISVALGQIYTERSRRLSDLIRRGKDLGRVTIVFDNTSFNGKRPIPSSHSDTFMISRYLRKDGSYWFEIDYKETSSSEVREILSSLNINPDNMLLIMHQGMVEEFAIVSPQDKLKMVEEVVGLTGYRERIIESQNKLKSLVSEENAIRQLMDMAKETLSHWKDVYDRYMRKQELIVKRDNLLREKFWAQVIKLEKGIEVTTNKLDLKRKELSELSRRLLLAEEKCSLQEKDMHSTFNKLKKSYHSLIFLDADKRAIESRIKSLSETIISFENILSKLNSLIQSIKEDAKDIRLLQKDITILLEGWRREADLESKKVDEIVNEINLIEKSIAEIEEGLFTLIRKYSEEKANATLLAYQKRVSEKEVSEIEHNLNELKAELENLETQKEAMKPRPSTVRPLNDIESELSSINAQLETYSDVPDEAKNIFEAYSSRYKELEEKLKKVIENKEIVLQELEERKKVWHDEIYRILDFVNPKYQELLRGLNAYGYIRLINEEEFEKAGLELLIGFRGARPAVLDAYTLSGGERSTATIAFLLALQKLSPSPIVAVDEFDVHMDPVNRERMFRAIFQMVQDEPKQYIVITPSQVNIYGDNVNYIVTQIVDGKSGVGAIARK